MARGKYLSLEEARKKQQLDRFCKEHPSTGDKDAFDDILGGLIKNPSEASGASSPVRPARSSGTRTRQGS
jgi:hypothetical protein